MARNEFLQDVHRAVLFMSPRVEADIPFTDANYIEKMLRGTDLWLAQGVTAAFRPEDFSDLDQGTRQRLTQAVSQFLTVTHAVQPKKPASSEQQNAALGPFLQIVQIVQAILRDDWMRAANKLLAEAEGWVKEDGWPTKRYPKQVTDDFIGTYELDRLVFSAEGAQLALVPVGRFAPGTDGLFDLAVMPAYDSVMVVRRGTDGSSIRCLEKKAGRTGQRRRSSPRVPNLRGFRETREENGSRRAHESGRTGISSR